MFHQSDFCQNVQEYSTPFIEHSTAFLMASTAGRKSKNHSPSGFQFDFLCFKCHKENAEQLDATTISHDKARCARPISEPPAPKNHGKQSSGLQFNTTEFNCLPLATKKQNHPTAHPPGITPLENIL